MTKVLAYVGDTVEAPARDDLAEPPTVGFTDTNLIQAKRAVIMRSFSEHLGVNFVKRSPARFATIEGDHRAVCSVSKRYFTGSAYWYGYAPEWDEFLAKGVASFLILGCMDRDVAYALPRERMAAVLDSLHRTPGRHWHISLEDDGHQGLYLVPRVGMKMSLASFEFFAKG
jgi:hypothetical protein